jgi:hypothetical protein
MLKITPASPEDSNAIRLLVEGRVAGAAGTQLERAIAGFTPRRRRLSISRASPSSTATVRAPWWRSSAPA